MHKVRFAIDFGEKEPGPDGCDAVRFLMSANAGEDLKPIARIASGGELARIMLALKNVLAEQESIGTLVFDEVDTGVSGRAAQKVAEKLAQVSRRKQVLCVTHLPQLAAMADTHFSVEKGGARRPHLYPCGAAGPGAAEGGAGPDHRRQPRDRGPAGKRRRAAGPGGALSERIRNEESCGMSNFWVRLCRTHSNCSACSRTHEFRTPN